MEIEKETEHIESMNDRETYSQDPDCKTPDINEDDLIELGRHNREAIQAVFEVLIAPDIGQQTTAQTILCRTVALAHVLHVPGIGDKSLTALAARIGVGKALLSSYCCKLRDFGKLDSRAGRTITARKKMAEARRESHAGRNNKRNST
jgi:hypothetical protein